MLERLTELRKVLHSKFSFIINDTDQEQPNEEKHRLRSGKIPHTLLMERGCITLSVYQSVHQPGSSPQLWCPKIRYTCIAGEITGPVIKLNLLSPFPLWKLSRLRDLTL